MPKKGIDIYYHDKDLANRLAIFRKKYVDEKQVPAAEKLGISQSRLSYMENGRLPITVAVINILVNKYGMNSDWFSTGNGSPKDKNPSKKTLITDINTVNQELESIRTQLKILQVTQNHFIKIIERLQKEIEKNKLVL